MSLKSRLTLLNKEIHHLNQTITIIDKIIDTIDQEVECLDDTISVINSEIDQSLESIKPMHFAYKQSFDQYRQVPLISSKNQQTQTEHSRFESMYEELKDEAAPVVGNILWATIKRLLCVCIL